MEGLRIENRKSNRMLIIWRDGRIENRKSEIKQDIDHLEGLKV